MDAHTKAMIATFVFMLVWIVGAFVLFLHERAYYKKNPEQWSRRFEGMVSLTDNQRYWCFALWPLVLCGMAVAVVIALIARVFEFYSDRKYESKYPNVVSLESVQFTQDRERAVTMIRHAGGYIPARPMGYASYKQRFKCAWMVFTGKADALVWPGGQ